MIEEEKPIKMICPICQAEVHKFKETDNHVKTKIICENEYYQHYDGDRLIKFKHPVEYKAPIETLHYVPLKPSIFFS